MMMQQQQETEPMRKQQHLPSTLLKHWDLQQLKVGKAANNNAVGKVH